MLLAASITSFFTFRRPFSAHAVLLIFYLLTACATPPKSTQDSLPVKVPGAWTASTPNPATTGPGEAPEGWEDWLEDFNTPVLFSLVQEALEYNYDLRATAARLEAARYDVVIAGADRLPQVSGNFGAQRQQRNFIGFPSGLSNGASSEETVTSTISDNFDLSLDLSWEFDLWGRLRDRKSAAIADFQAVTADFEGARLSLAAQVVQSWLSVLEAQLRLYLIEKTAHSFQDNADLIQKRFDRGLSPALDLRLTRANAMTAHSAVYRQERILDERLRDLAVLLGRYPDLNEFDFALSEDLPTLQTEAPVGAPVELLTRRPDLIAAERRLAAAGVRVQEARKALLPNIALSASGGTTAEDIEDLVDSDFSVWTLAGQLIQPLFQGGRLTANVKRSEAVQKEVLADYAGTALNAFQEVEAALAAENLLAEEERRLLETADESIAAEILAQDRYEKGLTDITTVLESQRRAFNSQSEHLGVRLQRLINRVTLYLALGGGFEE